eukprot:TRINITY_DN4357_c0_g1_i19.p1 TRINITY_DN4357_c0_g1~~TRINITY_DN4357_c0_g1_i19.p1  ORF type:complete len:102 (+),score=19.03 TRINITY_DN4357_c0_g1_i19:109-414(+)
MLKSSSHTEKADLRILSIFVEKGEKFAGKTKSEHSLTSSPYCVLSLLSVDGTKIKSEKTSTLKDTLDPVWNETITMRVESFNGLRIEVWDKHRMRKDKFMV